MGRSVVVRLVTGDQAKGRLAAQVHDVETGAQVDVRDAAELVAVLEALVETSRTARADESYGERAQGEAT
jgi:hypothetical protein